MIGYQKMMSTVYWEDFEMEGSGMGVLRAKKETYVGRAVEEPQCNAVMMAAVVGVTSLLAAIGIALTLRAR